jgi:hypothetical protein
VVERCPTCHGPLEHEALFALAEAFSTRGGMTYAEAAAAFGRSTKRIQNVVCALRLEVRYRRVGSHPRRHAVLPPSTIRALGHYLPKPQPHVSR